MSLATLLQLADGRLPTGGHAHSGGLEEAVASGRVAGIDDLGAYLRGRLATTGRVDAALAAAARHRAPHVAPVDAEAAARCPSPALRRTSRVQGRGLLRAARRVWPAPVLDAAGPVAPDGPLWPVALGRAGAAAGLDPASVALVALHATLAGPAWAATRLLGADPYEVAACLGALAPAIDQAATVAATAAAAAAGAHGSLADLPAGGGPLTEIGAERHAAWEVRLFAS